MQFIPFGQGPPGNLIMIFVVVPTPGLERTKPTSRRASPPPSSRLTPTANTAKTGRIRNTGKIAIAPQILTTLPDTRNAMAAPGDMP